MDVSETWEWEFDLVKRKAGLEYLTVKNVNILNDNSDVIVNLDNLFGGDETLGKFHNLHYFYNSILLIFDIFFLICKEKNSCLIINRFFDNGWPIKTLLQQWANQ